MAIFIAVFGILVFVVVDWLGQVNEDKRVFRVYCWVAYVIGS